MLQESVKESDSMKIGRFGLGFKSVLHLTGKIVKTEDLAVLILCNVIFYL